MCADWVRLKPPWRTNTCCSSCSERHDVATGLCTNCRVDDLQDLIMGGAHRLRDLHAVRRHERRRGGNGRSDLVATVGSWRIRREDGAGDDSSYRSCDPGDGGRGVCLGFPCPGFCPPLLLLILQPSSHRLPPRRTSKKLHVRGTEAGLRLRKMPDHRWVAHGPWDRCCLSERSEGWRRLLRRQLVV